MSATQELKKELEINQYITFKEATVRIPTLSRSNYDKIKCEWRKEKNKKDDSSEKKSSRKSKKKKTGHKKNPPDTTKFHLEELTTDSLEQMVILRINGKLPDVSDSLLRTATDILLKLKGTDSEGMEELDMESFLHDPEK